MTIIDVHTHMLNADFLRRLESGSDVYGLGTVPAGDRAIFRSGVPFLTITEAMLDYELRLKAMDDAGVDIAVVSLTCPNVFWGDDDASAGAARLMNDDMAAAQQRWPDRIRYLASIPWQHPDRAVAELERACAAGAVGVMTLANIDGVSLTDPRFAPVWQAIDDRALPVLVHPTTPPGVEAMDLSKYHLVWSVGFTFDTTLAVSRMILDGFFDRYTRLKIIAGHAGGYLPFVLSRLDAGFRSFPAVSEAIARPPSSYTEQIFLDAIVYDEKTMRFVIDVFGPDQVLYGSDYPHKNGRMEEIVELVNVLPESERARVFSGNAERIFQL